MSPSGSDQTDQSSMQIGAGIGSIFSANQQSGIRTTPYVLPYPYRVEETVVLKVGDNIFRTKVIDYKIDTSHFTFLGEGKLQGQEFIINYSLQTKTDHVAPDDYEAYRQSAKNLKTKTRINVLVADMQWPEPEVAWDEVESEVSLDSAIDFFNQENDELGIGIDRPPLTSDDVILAITELDRSFVPMSDSIHESLQLINVHRILPEGVSFEASSTSADSSGTRDHGWTIGLCIRLGYPVMPFCVPIRVDKGATAPTADQLGISKTLDKKNLRFSIDPPVVEIHVEPPM